MAADSDGRQQGSGFFGEAQGALEPRHDLARVGAARVRRAAARREHDRGARDAAPHRRRRRRRDDLAHRRDAHRANQRNPGRPGRRAVARDRARACCARSKRRSPSRPTHRPFVILAVGVNGTGKTTTVGKLAHRLEGRGPYRAARRRRHVPRRGRRAAQGMGRARAACPSSPRIPGADPAAVVHDALVAARARNIDVVLADTAGRLHTAAGPHGRARQDQARHAALRRDRAARDSARARREPRPERARAGAAASTSGSSSRARDHEARRHGEGRHPARDRAPAQSADSLRRASAKESPISTTSAPTSSCARCSASTPLIRSRTSTSATRTAARRCPACRSTWSAASSCS